MTISDTLLMTISRDAHARHARLQIAFLNTATADVVPAILSEQDGAQGGGVQEGLEARVEVARVAEVGQPASEGSVRVGIGSGRGRGRLGHVI